MQSVPTILLAEDDDGHALLIQNSLRKAGFRNGVRRFRDGQEALDFLFPAAETSPEREKAWVLLLDIRMPKVDGIEVLRRIRSDSGFNSMPVIVVTTMDDPGEVQRCRQMGCSSYIVKPGDWKLFTAALSNLSEVFSPSGRLAAGAASPGNC